MARKILLADDSVTAQNMGRKILADAGYDVITVNNGSAALKRIAEIKPDLIVLDVYMPGYSGLEVCQRLKDADETARIPVLLTVGKLEPFKAEEARRVRADAHIVKPFEASELLTAITRLEDRVVAHPSEAGRFSTSVSGVERFGDEGVGWKAEGDTNPDTGWKSRLRFPPRKKKEEPEAESDDIATGATFRDFRRAKGKTGGSGVFALRTPPPGQEPGLVPDIPPDITPEELDALSALAAKLDGPIPAAENMAPLAEKIGPIEAPAAEVAAAKTETAKAEVEVPAAAVEAKKEVETPMFIVEPAVAGVEITAFAVEAPASTVEGKSEVESLVEQVEPAAESAPLVADPEAEVIHQYEPQHLEPQYPETPAAVAAVAVNTALLAQEPAPVDRNDEPMFAAAASAVEQAAEDKAEEKIEGKPTEAVAEIEKSETAEVSAPGESVAAKGLEFEPEESNAQELDAGELKAEELKAESPLHPVAAAVSGQETAEADAPAPSDEELAEALRLLTPATAHAVSPVPSSGNLVAADESLAEEVARNAAAGPRWIAEPVALSPEESAISLEAEMFRMFAGKRAASAATSGAEIESRAMTGVSAIAVAVENRAAAAEMAAGAKVLAGEEDERASGEASSTEFGGGTTAAETPVVEAPAEVTAPVPYGASWLVDAIAPQAIEPEKVAQEAEQKDSAARVAEDAFAEEVAAATFANAVGQDGVEAEVAEENQYTSSDSGGRESMGGDMKTKSGKSNWHQIRTAPASAAVSSDVETAKQAEPVAEDAPKAMAAVAAADGSKASATDAGTIASIVDSVLADLRPKIVEEIAKKLAGK